MAKKVSIRKDTMKQMFQYVKKHSVFVILSVLFAAVSVALTLYVPILIGDAVDYIVAPGKVDFPRIMRILLVIGVCIGVTAIAQWIMNICNNRITYHVVHDIRKDAFDKLQILPLKYVDSHSQGEIVSRVIADVDQFADGLLMGFTQFFTGIVTILGTLLFMLTIHPGITLVVIVITPVSLFVAAFIAKNTYDMFQQQSKARGEQTALIDEMIGNKKIVQAFGREEAVLNRFDGINE